MDIQNPWLMKFDDRDVVQYRNSCNNVRFSLPEIDRGFVQWLNKYCDVYHVLLGEKLFDQHFAREKENAVKQILNHAYLDQTNSARVGRICNIVQQAHDTKWHSPSFLSKINNTIHFATGQKKIVATGIAKSRVDYHCVLWDFDRNLDMSDYDLVELITDDTQLAEVVGSNDYVLDINFVDYGKNILPGVYHFTPHYPASYEQDLSDIASSNKIFFQQQIPEKTATITVLDNFDSDIYDSSGIFSINKIRHSNTVVSTDDVRRELGTFDQSSWYFQTKQPIIFDLAHMLPYFRADLNMFYACDGSWFSWIHSDDYAETRCAPQIR